MLGIKGRVVPVIHRPARLRYHTGHNTLLNSVILIPDLGWQKFASHYSFEEIIMSIFGPIWCFFILLFSGIFKNCEKQLSASPCLSVLVYGTTRLPLNGFLLNFILHIFKKSIKKFQVSLISEKNSGYFTWRPIYIYMYMIISSSDLLRMRNVSDRSSR